MSLFDFVRTHSSPMIPVRSEIQKEAYIKCYYEITAYIIGNMLDPNSAILITENFLWQSGQTSRKEFITMAAAIQKIIHCWCNLSAKSFVPFGADSKNNLWKILQTCVGTVSVPMVILHTSECVLCYTASKPSTGCPCSIDFTVEK